MRALFSHLGVALMAAGITVVVMDAYMLHPIWSYGGALFCLGALVFLINELENM